MTTSIGLPSKPLNRSVIFADPIAAGSLAGRTRESTCANAIFVIGAAITPSNRSEPITTGTGRFMTPRAVCAQRPSSLGVIPPFRTAPLSILCPSSAMIAGSGISAPRTAKVTTLTPA